MFLTKKLLTALILPPTGLILLALVGLWLALSDRRPRRYAGISLSALALSALMALSIPAVSRYLPIERVTSPISSIALAQAQAIVILGGGIYANAPEFGGDTLAGSGLERVHYGAKLARDSKLPVLTTGGAPFGGAAEGEVMRKVLEREFNVPVRWVESQSRDTAENAKFSAVILKQAGISRIALISHATHLPRAIPLFEKEGLTVLPAPTIVPRPGVRVLEITDFLPSAGTLSHSSNALYEMLGRLANHLAERISKLHAS